MSTDNADDSSDPELDERHVALMAGAGGQLLDVLGAENLVGAGPGLVDAGSGDVVDPVGVGHVAEEDRHRGLVGVDRRVREVVLVAQAPHEVVVVVHVERDQRRVGALAGDADPAEVRLQAGDGDLAVLALEPPADVLAIGLVDVGRLGESAAGVLEATGEVLGVVDGHTGRSVGRYYKLAVGETTCSISCERVKTRLRTPDEASRTPDVAIETPTAPSAGRGGVPA